MIPLLVMTLAMSPQNPPSSVELPVSLERIRQELQQLPGPFDLPPSRPWRRPLFRVTVQEEFVMKGDGWEETGIVPPWVRPIAPSHHYEFLTVVTPEETRSATLHPCCNVTPLIEKAASLISSGVRSVQKRRAKREFEAAMRAAGIKEQ